MPPKSISWESVSSNYINWKMWKIKALVAFILLCSVIVSVGVNGQLTASDPSCHSFSAAENEDYWYIYISLKLDINVLFYNLQLLLLRLAISRCSQCAMTDGCGFCQSTLQCLSGAAAGPSNGSPCSSWSYTIDTCPGIQAR